MQEPSVNPEKNEPAKRMGPIAWLKNYGYYYKGWMTVGVIGIIVIVAVIFMLRYDGADLRLIVVTQDPIDNEAYYNFANKVEAYVYDVDGDNTAIPRHYRYTLTENKDSLPLSELPEKLENKEYLGFVVDDAGYEYIKTLCQLRELSYFGVQSDADDPYRLTLNGTPLLEGTGMDGATYYLVMKYIDNTNYNDLYVSGRTDLLVGMGLNNDSNAENDVTITKSNRNGFSLFGR